VRRQRDEQMLDFRTDEQIRDVLDTMIVKITKLHALPRGTVLCEGKSKDVIDYCRTIGV